MVDDAVRCQTPMLSMRAPSDRRARSPENPEGVLVPPTCCCVDDRQASMYARLEAGSSGRAHEVRERHAAALPAARGRTLRPMQRPS